MGKTSLAHALSSELSLPLIPEIARKLCLELGYDRIGSIPDQEGFKKQVLEKQIEAENSCESFVGDRGALDCWVLWQRWNICSAMTHDTEYIYRTVAAHMKSYSHIIYIPPLFEITEDEFRWSEPDYIKQLDRIFRMSLFELDCLERVYTINSGELAGRMEEVQNWLSKMKNE